MSPFPIAAGRRYHQITLRNPAFPTPDEAPEPDGDGSFLETPYTTLAVVRASIERAGSKRLERITSGTVIAQATHIVTTPYLSGVTTKTEVVFGTRVFRVADVTNPDERNRELQLMCSEVVA